MYKRGEEVDEHECSNNFERGSKIMEAVEILNMVEYAFLDYCFIIDVIIRHYDRKMEAVLKHLSIGSQGQVMKSSKGNIDEKNPVPSFLVDLLHHVKFIT